MPSLTIGWNVVEGVIAVAAGLVAGSVSLVGFGLDSGIEVSAAAILAWRLGKESQLGCMADFDRRATQLIAVSFAELAAYVGVESVRDLIGHRAPGASVVGVVVAGLSLLVMPLLARAKRRLAPVLGSQAAASEANQTSLCALLSGGAPRRPRSQCRSRVVVGGPDRGSRDRRTRRRGSGEDLAGRGTRGHVLRVRGAPPPLHSSRVRMAITLYGVAAVTFMMVMYALESRDHRFVLGFAVGCVLSSGYGFMAGAWPFGVVELVWAVVAVRRWLTSRAVASGRAGPVRQASSAWAGRRPPRR